MRWLPLILLLVACSDPVTDPEQMQTPPELDASARLDFSSVLPTDSAAIVDVGLDAQPIDPGVPDAEADAELDAAPDTLDPDIILLPDVSALCRGVDCSAVGEPCAPGTCDPRTGECFAERLADGAACDDGRGCTEGTTCTTGICGGGRPVDCGALSGPCSAGRCNADTGECEARSANEGAACETEDSCQSGGVCRVGECRGQPMDCSELDDTCVIGRCDPVAGCQATPAEDGDACSVDDPCLAGGVCAAGECVGDDLRDCSAFDGPCVTGVCTEAGGCEAQPIADGTVCSEPGDLCAQQICQGGVCLAPAPTDCSAMDTPCMQGVCEAEIGCTAEPRAACVGCPGGLCDGAGECAPNTGDRAEDFEGVFPGDFNAVGDQRWIVVGDQAQSGARSAQSGQIGNRQTSEMGMAISSEGRMQVSYWFRVSSEPGFDEFEFLIGDMNPFGPYSGEVPWQEGRFGLPAGNYVLRWRYSKDRNVAQGADRAWVDNIRVEYECDVEGECVRGHQVNAEQCLVCPIANCP